MQVGGDIFKTTTAFGLEKRSQSRTILPQITPPRRWINPIPPSSKNSHVYHPQAWGKETANKVYCHKGQELPPLRRRAVSKTTARSWRRESYRHVRRAGQDCQMGRNDARY